MRYCASRPGLRLHKAGFVVFLATPLVLFVPAATGAPLDAGLPALALLLALWRPRVLGRAVRSGAFLVLAGLALLAWLASGRSDAATAPYVAKFMVGAFTGILLHFVYVEHARLPVAFRRRTALLLAIYIASLSYTSLISGVGHTQLAMLTLPFGTLVVFHLLRTDTRLIWLAAAVPAFLLLNSKTLLFALLAGCVVLGNLRAHGDGLRFLWVRAAALTVVLVPLALTLLWYSNPERFADFANPTRSHSTMARLDLATAGVAAFRDNPLLGLGGYGMNIDYNFHRYYEEQNLARLIKEGRTRSHGQVYGTGFTSGVHNMFLDYLTTYGGLSFAILLVLFGRGLVVSLHDGYGVKIAAALTMLALGMAWQFTASAFGTAMLIFACWPFRFTVGTERRGLAGPGAAGVA